MLLAISRVLDRAGIWMRLQVATTHVVKYNRGTGIYGAVVYSKCTQEKI